MDRVAGKSLDKLWHGLDASQKMEIVQQLKESFDAIRDLPGPGFFGSIDRTKPRDFFFDFDEPMPSLDGPFHTEEALINGLVDRYLAEDPERRRCESEYYRKHLMKQLKGDGQSVFTHGDLQLKNIMLQPNGRIIIIDWATSGWYPVYWEYIVAICAHGGWTNDWHSHIHLFLDEYPNHYVWMNRLLLDRYY
ncbi:hypothetical protein SEPCBS119000_002504 [Sporothrix epigloea]|uniref:Aminoglycoside phosphotransferase domain-containing protein n=1 Tax=Sporothrix epigloea TaxID=1892477 RepID=A0ABP0DGI6_9PEZI